MRLLTNFATKAALGLAGMALFPAVSIAQSGGLDFSSWETEALERRFVDIVDDRNRSTCKLKVPLINELRSRDPKDPWYTRSYHVLNMQCLMEQERPIEAYDHLLALEEATDDLDIQLILGFVYATEEPAIVLDRLERLYLSDDKAVQEILMGDLVFPFLRFLREDDWYEKYEALADRVIAQRGLESFHGSLQGHLAYAALQHAVREADVAKARTLMPSIIDPRRYAHLLANREFAAIWPAVEERVGANYSTITGDFERELAARFENDRHIYEALSSYMHALLFDGQFAEVIEETDYLMDRPDWSEKLIEQEAWALNVRGYALDALGRTAEADAVFDRFTELANSELGKRWGVSFLINRSSRLVELGRWEEGLAAARFAADFRGTDYARMLLTRDQLCALHALGRTEEMAEHLAVLEELGEGTPAIYAAALQCIDRPDEAAAVVLAELDKDEPSGSLLEALQHEAFDMFYTRQVLPQPRDLLETHPELQEALLKHVRIIPEEFYPHASLMR